MSDLLAVVTRNRDDIEDIEEYVAREQSGDRAPTRPRRGSPAPDRRPLERRQTGAMARVIGRRGGGRRPDLRRPAARGRPPGRRAGPRPAAGDDLGGGRRDLVPLPRLPAGPGARLVARVVRRVRRAGGRSPDTGVAMRTRHRGARATPQADPWWRAGRAGPGPRDRAARRATATRWTFVAPVVEMPVYLAGWPRGWRTLGGTHHPAEPLGAARRAPTWSSTAPGIGARLLAADPTVRAGARPGRARRAGRAGALVARRRPDPTYVVPRSHDIVVGGTDEEGEWSRTPSPETAAGDPARGPAGWCPSWRARRCCGTGSGCGRRGPQVRVERVRGRGALLRPRRRRRHAELGHAPTRSSRCVELE